MSIPVIETSGSPYEVGYQHGRQAAEQVRASFRRWCRYAVGDSHAREQLRRVVEANVARRLPEALEEMRGIADGAGMVYEQIRDLNFSGELWSETFLDPPSRACTLVGLAATPHGELIGKTLDAAEGDDAYLLVQRVRPDDGHTFLHLTFAGTLWSDGGVNEHGLGEVNSSLCTTAHNVHGFPPFIMLRELLKRCASLEAAVRMAMAYEAINYGNNILLANDRGELAVVERSVSRQAVRWGDAAQTPAIFATNHSLDPRLEPVLGGGETLLANSQERFDRLVRLSGTIPSSLEGLQALLRDHERPGGCCQHGQGNLHTVSALIVAPRLRQLWVTAGPPCQNGFVPTGLLAQEAGQGTAARA